MWNFLGSVKFCTASGSQQNASANVWKVDSRWIEVIELLDIVVTIWGEGCVIQLTNGKLKGPIVKWRRQRCFLVNVKDLYLKHEREKWLREISNIVALIFQQLLRNTKFLILFFHLAQNSIFNFTVKMKVTITNISTI